VGGIIPRGDIPKLKAMGVGEVFRPGAKLADIVAYVKDHAPRSARPA
jgi:methylmalonyl-CoA mutase C-terminal domain/subunit